jgi:subtilase family serine protease
MKNIFMLSLSVFFWIQQELPKPDLRVEEFSLVSVTRDAVKKMYCIQVLIRVKNIGKGSSGEYQIAGYYNSPTGSRRESRISDVIIVPATAPGASFVKVYRFMEPEKEIRNGLFEFRIKADDRNKVIESDELNNYSVTLRLETPAEK